MRAVGKSVGAKPKQRSDSPEGGSGEAAWRDAARSDESGPRAGNREREQKSKSSRTEEPAANLRLTVGTPSRRQTAHVTEGELWTGSAVAMTHTWNELRANLRSESVAGGGLHQEERPLKRSRLVLKTPLPALETVEPCGCLCSVRRWKWGACIDRNNSLFRLKRLTFRNDCGRRWLGPRCSTAKVVVGLAEAEIHLHRKGVARKLRISASSGNVADGKARIVGDLDNVVPVDPGNDCFAHAHSGD